MKHSFNNIQQAFDWLENHSSITQIKLGLERIEKVAKHLKLKHFPLSKVICVAGTNGKGSTCFLLEGLLRQLGYSVGLYTSPHIKTFNERIRYNTQNIEDEQLLSLFKEIYLNCQLQNINLSYFEFTTLCALLFFKNKQCDFIILEVGLGGRLDACNVVKNDCSIITSIALDHQNYLGNTVEAIAQEKSGIFKNNKTVILASNLPEICRQLAIQKNCQIYEYGKNFGKIKGEQNFHYFANNPQSLDLPIMDGSWQVQNLSLAVMSLLSFGLTITNQLIQQTVKNTIIKARLQAFQYKNLSGWIDVAHNEESAASLTQFIQKKAIQTQTLFSCLNDKEPQLMIKKAKKITKQWHITEIDNERALSVDKIKRVLIKEGINKNNITVYQNQGILQTINDKLKNTDDNNKCLIFGSFILISNLVNQGLEI